MKTVDYYFSLISPYSYLGHAAVLDVARETGARLVYRPVRIFELFDANGGLPLAKRAPARQRYRLVELQRWREWRGLPLNLAPKFYPVDIALADRCAIALAEAGADPAGYMDAAFRALWAEDRDLADPAELARLLAAQGADAEAVLAAARTDAIEAIYRGNTERAIAADLPGLPGYVLEGEPFWGQDRIDMLHAALRSGRAPYRAAQ
ncbi:2-hydroxychromene-2-carboxylate isomerase [Vulcaniibacterium tengchongense]|uniref:2-hydroxychromene-2-carboxylate isomerase n=1 Tax=Vulcaniibacterium tengchongense TaxID=1273429 RepID=A0A3N4VD47_9GAMM|nr:2-hydroxychromene-2-carboxylate isomerase [Vulcaniibacterium tengchongense]RPE80942.1 2-hydroxychromene-2-carboxylate isomerase [Vulcaniibacterium tengchongense]